MKNIFFLFLTFLSGIALGKPPKYHNIPYLPGTNPEFDKERHIMDIYTPDSISTKTEVVIFIHGGKWKVGSKENYRFLGKKLAKRNIVTVVINYRLSPTVPDYSYMAMDCAQAVKWVYEHIEEYGGDKNKIFLYGHSSGGHLCALIASNNRFFDEAGIANPVKGCILFDSFGLTIDQYLPTAGENDNWMFDIFTKRPLIWKDAAPANFIKEDSVRYLLYNGDNSPYRIKQDGIRFFNIMMEKKKNTRLITIGGVGHLGLLFQLYYTKHPMYNQFVAFMRDDT